MMKALLHEPAVIFGDGNQSRDFIYVQDVVRANLLAATIKGAGGQVINIGSGKSVAINELWEKICALSGQNLEPEYAPKRPGDIVDSVAGVESAGARLGFECEIPFEKGLEATFEWYRNSQKSEDSGQKSEVRGQKTDS
jgi:nucleoside-diphosphate-sugar epimerase